MDLLILLIALACAPYMLARMLKLPDPPSPRELWAAVSPVVGPALELLGYLLKRAIAFGWEPTEDEKPALLRTTRYVIDEEGEAELYDPSFSPFERAERSSFVQDVQSDETAVGLDPRDITRIDVAARILAGGLTGEAAAIELLFDGVKRGGSRRYQTIRDAVRARAEGAYGWKPPVAESGARVVTVHAGRPDERTVSIGGKKG